MYHPVSLPCHTGGRHVCPQYSNVSWRWMQFLNGLARELYSPPPPDLPELPASGPKTASLPASSSTLLPMKSPSSSLREYRLYKYMFLAGPHAQISASSSSLSSSSNLPSVTPTDTPKPKNPTPAGAIAGGKFSVHHNFPVAWAKTADAY